MAISYSFDNSLQQLKTNLHPDYQLKPELIKKYAQILVHFALNSGEGLQPGEVVQVYVPDVAKPMALALQNEILQAGGHPLMRLLPTGFDRDYYTLANQEQLTHFPQEYKKAKAKLIDHQIQILADPYPEQLKQVEPKKVIAARDAQKPYKDWLMEKENQGDFTWTLALWGVQAKADKVGLTLEEYWQQIINAVYLDQADPIAKWQRIQALQEEIKAKLNALPIKSVHIKGPDADLTVQIGQDRRWVGGSGRNIPSFEIFTSPNWRGVEGWMRFNEPVYRYGNIIQDVYLQFKEGRLVKAVAEQGNKFLQEMVKSPNADKAGEFSLTDKRMSRITHPMAETLFDENMGGPYGNSHVAIGMAYKDCYRGEDSTELSKQDWEEKGFNDAAEHTDFVSTTDRVVTATLADGSQQIIYQEGQFVL
jgi:aminopeptidase